MKKAFIVLAAAAAIFCSCMSGVSAEAGARANYAAQEHVIEIPVVVGPSLSSVLSQLEASPAGMGE